MSGVTYYFFLKKKNVNLVGEGNFINGLTRPVVKSVARPIVYSPRALINFLPPPLLGGHFLPSILEYFKSSVKFMLLMLDNLFSIYNFVICHRKIVSILMCALKNWMNRIFKIKKVSHCSNMPNLIQE